MEQETGFIKENLKEVEERIQKACERAGRNRDEVTLVAVSKTKPLQMIEEAYDAGIRVFGENKVQELAEKHEKLPGDIRWQMIGHLQRNKVKNIIDKVDLIHSVDSIRLLETIEKEAEKKNVTANVLLEVNMAKEESKFGLFPEEVLSFTDKLKDFPHVIVRGLMTIAPDTDNPEENRQYFSGLRKLSVDIASKNIDNIHMGVLSMGMTNDYEVAIEEGATMVRIGTGIFGKRNYALDKNTR
ncbi:MULTISPECIES: YggS family pyridoxal phosphate-dependent enzyme [Sellimonas]|uniref:Pyridoxal phosphate homeostasis protein n=1 Tax=Sellimonas caecigallum TaxID=2592333 RepID=A0ABS7L8R5_9FIRM|nr:MULTISPECIES: YggS family pyridoxal phosphate-dependent enzyme [Sellimonas]MBY0759460.1 YggS family pyridoxal phosphate-dependent enzyme [Sellimonas caecigallum]OUP02174.1 YggS family pyridoxal phosphate enzyme [Drancourtella sp. An210]OUP64581.1 YggS family pyridoxal phosphate enzyme [Drancourtella sp. An177]